VPRRVIDDIRSPVGWSPDGQHVAFVRNNLAASLSMLMTADADGSHERELTARRGGAFFTSLFSGPSTDIRPAWSPDGHLIAMQGAGGGIGIVFVTVSSGLAQTTALPTPANGLAWLDQGALVLVAPPDMGTSSQLFRMTYPDGKLSRLTNDLNDYTGVSLTADRRSLVTARTEQRVGVWVGDSTAATGTDVVPPTPFTLSRFRVTWAADRLLYTTTAGGPNAITSLLPGRGAPEEVISKASSPGATWDGRTIVYTSTTGGAQGGLWKADADGRHAVQLVPGDDATKPVVTPDDRHVIFVSSRSGLQSPWMVSIDGASPTQIVNEFIGADSNIDVSPDSKSIVLTLRGEVLVCDLPACTSRRSLPTLAFGAWPHWMPDGRAIAYRDATQSNLWVQPLDGKPPRQLTHFREGRAIVDFGWSRDGKRLAIARSTTSNDIVLFKGLK
jgi:Tol biopolymer transport system component